MIVCKTFRGIEITVKLLYQGLKEVKTGERLSNISHAIQNYVVAKWFFDCTRVCWTQSRERLT